MSVYAHLYSVDLQMALCFQCCFLSHWLIFLSYLFIKMNLWIYNVLSYTLWLFNSSFVYIILHFKRGQQTNKFSMITKYMFYLVSRKNFKQSAEWIYWHSREVTNAIWFLLKNIHINATQLELTFFSSNSINIVKLGKHQPLFCLTLTLFLFTNLFHLIMI